MVTSFGSKVLTLRVSARVRTRLRLKPSLCAIAVLTIPVALTIPGRSAAQTPSPALTVVSPAAPPAVAFGPPTPLSLAEAIFIGLRNNRTIQSGYLDRIAQTYDLLVAKARFRPTALVEASAEATFPGFATTVTPTAAWLVPTGAQFQFSWSRLDTRLNGQTTLTSTATVSVDQPLLRGAGLKVNEAPIRIAELQDQIDRLAVRSTVSSTIDQIILAYRALAQAQSLLAISQKALARSTDQLQINNALVQAGRIAAAELIQNEADLANQRVACLQAEQQKNSAQLSLLVLLAMDLHVNVLASDVVQPQHQIIEIDKAVSVAMSHRMDFLSQLKALEQGRQQLIVARNARLWGVDLTGSFQNQSQRGIGTIVADSTTGGLVSSASLPPNSGSLGVKVSIPLGDYTLRQAEVHARIAVEKGETQLADLRLQVEAEVRDAAQTVETSWQAHEAANAASDLSQKAFDVERQRLSAGRISNFELLSYEANLRSAENVALTASITYLNALTVFDQQLGTTLDTWQIAIKDP